MTQLSPRLSATAGARRRAPGCAAPSGATRRARATRSGAERLRPRLHQRRRRARCAAKQAWQASAGVERELGARRRRCKVEGYYKRFTDVLIGRLEPDAERLRAAGPLRLSGRAGAASIPPTPIITTVPTNDGRGHAYGFDLFVSRPAARPARQLARVGQLHLGPGRTRCLRPPLSVRVRPASRLHAGGVVPLHRRGGSWRRRRAWRRAFRARRRSGCAWPARRTTADGDGDGVTDEILPDARRRRAARLRGGLRRRRQPERRPPAGVRAGRLRGHVASARRGGPLGALRRGDQRARPAERRRLRAAAGVRPDADRPRIVEERDQAIPRLPTVGVRFRF